MQNLGNLAPEINAISQTTPEKLGKVIPFPLGPESLLSLIMQSNGNNPQCSSCPYVASAECVRDLCTR